MPIEVSYITGPEGQRFAECDENGHVVFVDTDKPEEDTTRKTAVDVLSTYKSVPKLRSEAAENRRRADDLMSKLDAFKDITDPAKAIDAMRVVQNLKDGELIKAGEVELLKKNIEASFADEKRGLVDGFTGKITEFENEIASKDNTIRSLLVSNEFAKSSFFTGEKPKTILPPDIAESYFGEFFKVEPINGKMRSIAYINGEKQYSKKNPGELASFDEAMERILDAHPNKNRLMASTNGGPPQSNNVSYDSNNKPVYTVKRSDTKDPDVYKEMKKKQEEGILIKVIED